MKKPVDQKHSDGVVIKIGGFTTGLNIRSALACLLSQGSQKLAIRCFLYGILFFAGPLQAQTSVISPSISVEASGGRSTGVLEVDRIELAFDNGLPRITTSKGQAISATAVVNTLGNGLFRAIWRVDGQVVQSINHPVSFGSILRLTLSGPIQLPTIKTGGHSVSLEVLSPALSTGNPEIRYFVTPTSSRKATLYTRSLGGLDWQQTPLNYKLDGSLELEIPTELMVSPGIEYYIQITEADGRRRTDPAKNPIRQPYKIEIPSVTQANKLFIQGKSENRLASEAIRIDLSAIDRTEIDLSAIRFVLDDIDVSGLMVLQGDSFLFDPPAALSAGNHILIATHELSGDDITLGQMEFSVAAATDADKSNTLYARGNVSFVFGDNIGSGQQNNQRNGNIALAFGGNQGDTEYSWNGINVNYDGNVDPDWDLSSGFTFTATNQNKQLEYGDINVNETDLTVSGFSRRGLKARVDSEGSSSGLFIVSTEPVTGFDTGLSTDSENQVYGASYSITDLGESSSNIDLVVVAGQNAANFGDSVVSTEGPSKGETIGVHADTLFGKTRLSLDLGVSSFDADLNDSANAETDQAYRISATHPLSNTQLSASLLHYGADYATVANPTFSGDRGRRRYRHDSQHRPGCFESAILSAGRQCRSRSYAVNHYQR